MFAQQPTEFTGSLIPKRSELWEEIDHNQTDDDEAAINANMHMHMVAHNASWGA